MAEINEEAIKIAAAKLARLRLTKVGGRKEHPEETVKSALAKGLGGIYEDAAIEYILRNGLKYYLNAVDA